VINILYKLFRIAGGSIAGNIQLKLDFNSDPFTSKKVNKLLKQKTEGFYQAVRKQKQPSLWNRLFNFIAIQKVIKPYVTRHSSRYKAVLAQWKKLKIR